MKTVDYLTEPGALVQHVHTARFGVFAGLNEHGRADVTWDDDQLTNASVELHLVGEVQR